MKHIETLIPDIYKMLEEPIEINEDALDRFAESIKQEIKKSLTTVREPRLSMSNFATPDRKLWYQMNQPEDAEKLTPNTKIKFMYGHMVEALVLLLAELSGHSVEGQQDTMKLGAIEGHRDGVIDGCTVDVKSANSRGFTKFKNNTLLEDDPFGYVDQLSLYAHAAADDPLVRNKSSAYFLAIDKELGYLALSEIKPKDIDYEQEYKRKMLMLSRPTPPERCYEDVEDGKSGNRKLCTQCSYCPFKKTCWPSLRVWLYSNGPRFLTVTAREPDVREVT